MYLVKGGVVVGRIGPWRAAIGWGLYAVSNTQAILGSDLS